MATLARACYQAPAIDPAELLEARSSASVTRLLLDGFVPTLYSYDRARRGYPTAAVLRWLAFPAYLPDRTASRDLWWWTLRPDLYVTRVAWRTVVASYLREFTELWRSGSRGLPSWRETKDSVYAMPRRPSSALAVLATIARGAAHRRGDAGRSGSLGYGSRCSPGGGARRRQRRRDVPGDVARQRSRHSDSSSRRASSRCTARFGVLFGLVAGIAIGQFVTCGLTWLLVGGAAVVFRPWTWPVRRAEVTPWLTVRQNRRAACAAAIQFGLLAAVAAIVAGIAVRPESPVWTLCFSVATFAFAAALGAGLWTWVRYRLVHPYAARRGWLPWRLWPFLVDAARRGVMRQAGTSWQFRHALLQDHFAELARTDHLRARAEAGDPYASHRYLDALVAQGRLDVLAVRRSICAEWFYRMRRRRSPRLICRWSRREWVTWSSIQARGIHEPLVRSTWLMYRLIALTSALGPLPP